MEGSQREILYNTWRGKNVRFNILSPDLYDMIYIDVVSAAVGSTVNPHPTSTTDIRLSLTNKGMRV